MQVLITGGTGFVGGHLKPFLENDNDVFISSRHQSGRGIIKLDLLNYEEVKKVLENYSFEKIFHLASQSSVHLSHKNPLSTISDNIFSALNLLRAAEHLKNSPKIILAGTAELYSSSKGPITEESELDPKNPYALSKLIPDIMTRYSGMLRNINFTTLRLFNHAGPGQSETFVLGSFSKQIARIKSGLAEPVMKVGNLKAKRDFVDVRDVCRAYTLVSNENETGQVYNICSGRAYSIDQLLKKLIEMANVDVEIIKDPDRMRPSDTPIIIGDYSKFNKKYSWEPEIQIDQTLEDMLEWWLKNL